MLPEIALFRGETDGALVVQVDTHGVEGRIRVNLNEGPVWDGDPETDAAPGSFLDADERFGVNEAYPNGRCTACGNGLTAAGRCTNSDCEQSGSGS